MTEKKIARTPLNKVSAKDASVQTISQKELLVALGVTANVADIIEKVGGAASKCIFDFSCGTDNSSKGIDLKEIETLMNKGVLNTTDIVDKTVLAKIRR